MFIIGNVSVHHNRSDCYANLVQTLNRLHKDDYDELATKELSRKCDHNDTNCSSRVNVFLDLFLRGGRNITQQLIIKHFLKIENPNENDTERIFFHIPRLRNPSLVIIFNATQCKVYMLMLSYRMLERYMDR